LIGWLIDNDDDDDEKGAKKCCCCCCFSGTGMMKLGVGVDIPTLFIHFSPPFP